MAASAYVCKGTIADIEEGPGDGALQPGRQELKRRFVEHRAQGHSLRRCADLLGVSKSTLATWSQELEAEISSLKAIELEALQEEFYLTKEGRIRLLGERLQALLVELTGRDLSEVATEKLLEFLLKYAEALRREYVEPKPLSGAQIRRLQDKTGPKPDSQALAQELGAVLERYRAGLIDTPQARQELYLLLAMLKAEEQTEIERKLESIEAALEVRH